MSQDGITFRLEGLADVRTALESLPAKLRQRAIRNALGAGARVFRDEAKRLTPAIVVPIRMANGMLRRAPGTVRNAIRVRTSKQARRHGDVGVFVNVRPAKGAFRGANKPFDPFYWRFLEFGTSKMPATGMLTQAARSKSQQALDRVQATLGPAIVRINRRQVP